MSGPICTFIDKYKASGAIRAHMPGHKGIGISGAEYDLTEITGADSLYEACGIIGESEKIASEIFGANTFYSTEGSTLSVKAMCYLVMQYATEEGKRGKILAARNAHKSFIHSASLLDFELEWLDCDGESYLDATVNPDKLREKLAVGETPTAVYITSPDYLGNILNIAEIAKACHDFGVLLLVDNAHGAYLKFLPESRHPIDLGADMCCDSAHKTLPCLTGGAYLHISKNAPALFLERAKDAMAAFGSTSPSYLILASLDSVNEKLACGYSESAAAFSEKMRELKAQISRHGYTLVGEEPFKIALKAKEFGYLGYELQELLEEKNIFTEFADPDYLVLMLSPSTSDGDILSIRNALMNIKRKEKINVPSPTVRLPKRVMSPREAMLSAKELIPCENAEGRVLAEVTVGCPPAVPIVVSGEKIDTDSLIAFDYYGIDKVWVVK